MSNEQKGGDATDTSAKQRYPFHKRFVRKPVEIRIEVERLSEALASSSINVSPSGICFSIGEPLELNEQMRILLYIPHGKEVEILRVQARVAWTEQVGENFRVGAEFTKFAPGDERRMRLWLLDLGTDKKPE